MNNSVIGLDIAKNIFHMYTFVEGKAIKKKLKRTVLKTCGHKKDKLSLWLQALIERRGFNKAAVALANKNARILWALASQEKEYDALRV